jgi:ubiquinone/menaquinone biosynthesis C-methylase UbiE
MDPAGREIEALQGISWRGKRVLEVGCGGGRLTLRIADFHPAKIIAFDPNRELIRDARKNIPLKHKSRIEYRVGNAEHVRQKANQFDVVIFSWAL